MRSNHSFQSLGPAKPIPYGYDFKKTSKEKISGLAKSLPSNRLIKNAYTFIERACLNNKKEVGNALSALSGV